MGTNVFLTEGGVAGHMNHLYDNGELTFAKIKEIFTAASNGEIEGTEKTDGQNLFISYSVQNGNARAARNKGNIKQGGLTAEELAAKFEGRGELTKTFVESFETFEKAVRSLDPETQINIFGPDANIYYNAEIMDPRSPNVVNYDTKSLVIHQVGHAEYDKATGEKVKDGENTKDVSANAKVLQSALEQMQQATAEDDYTVQINAVRRLEALEDDEALQDAIDSLDSAVTSVGLSDTATINQWMIERLKPHVQQSAPGVDEAVHQLIIRRLMKDGTKFTQVVKGLDREQKEIVRAIIKSEKELRKAAIQPVEEIIHDFSVEMLRGLQSAFILDNTREVERLRGEVSSAIAAIEGSNNEAAMKILNQHLKKLKSVENVSTASEGFVFDYDGVTYKFTGNFAPINQILGLFKYGRGDIPAMVKEEDVEQRDNDRYFGVLSEEGAEVDVAVVPGAFKPPHRGHLAMVAEYAKMAKRVIVFMSPLPRKLDDGREMGFDMAYQLWQPYLNSAGLTNVKVLESPVNSPVGATFKFVANEEQNPDWAQPGESVVLGVSNKGGDDSRFSDKAQKYAAEGVTVLAGPEYTVNVSGGAFTDSRTGEPLSASTMRSAISSGDIETFTEYLPDSLKGEAESLMNKLTPKDKEEIQESSRLIIQLISESLEELNVSGGCGSVVGVQGSVGVSKRTNKYDPWDEEEELEEESDQIDVETDVGIPREEMPQIKSSDMTEFVQWLKTNKGVDSKTVAMTVDDLKPSQSKINVDKVKGMLAKKSIDELSNSKPVLVTEDDYLVDGHHRWFALLVDDSKNTIKSVRVKANFEDFISMANEFPKVSYKSMVDENVVNEILEDILLQEGYENFGGQSKVLKVGSVILDIEDMELIPSKHGEERRFRHTKPGGGGHKISKDAIISAVDRSLGLIMNDYANGEIENGEAFHIRMKGKSNKVPALNVIAALDMKKGPDKIKIITVMRKDEFRTDNFGGGSQKTYNVGA